MAAKLNQVIAIVAGKKSQTQKAITEVYQQLQKPVLLEGISRTYRPKDEDGEQFPPEKKLVQLKATDAIGAFSVALTDLMDTVFAQDCTNQIATADVKVDGKVLLEKAPVTYLLFLEKQLVDIHTFVDKLPTLDPAEKWNFNKETDCYSSDPYQTAKTKKIPRNHVKAEATKEHPAQVEMYTEDVMVGNWTTMKFSGAIPASGKSRMLEKVRKLQEAVKFAREEANGREVVESKKVGAAVFGYLFA